VVCRFSTAYYVSMLCCVLIVGIELTERLGHGEDRTDTICACDVLLQSHCNNNVFYFHFNTTQNMFHESSTCNVLLFQQIM